MRSDAGPWQASREFLSAYISGYADGEGCFTVSIAPRATLLLGWEVRPSFSVSQNGDRAEVLQLIEATFGCGAIRPDRSDRTLKWETRRLEDLLDRVIPHFVALPVAVRQAVRLRTVRGDLPVDGRRRASASRRSHRDRRARADDESERAPAVFS